MYVLPQAVTAMLLLTASLPIIDLLRPLDDSDIRAAAMDNKTKTALMLKSACKAATANLHPTILEYDGHFMLAGVVPATRSQAAAGLANLSAAHRYTLVGG